MDKPSELPPRLCFSFSSIETFSTFQFAGGRLCGSFRGTSVYICNVHTQVHFLVKKKKRNTKPNVFSLHHDHLVLKVRAQANEISTTWLQCRYLYAGVRALLYSVQGGQEVVDDWISCLQLEPRTLVVFTVSGSDSRNGDGIAHCLHVQCVSVFVCVMTSLSQGHGRPRGVVASRP